MRRSWLAVPLNICEKFYFRFKWKFNLLNHGPRRCGFAPRPSTGRPHPTPITLHFAQLSSTTNRPMSQARLEQNHEHEWEFVGVSFAHLPIYCIVCECVCVSLSPASRRVGVIAGEAQTRLSCDNWELSSYVFLLSHVERSERRDLTKQKGKRYGMLRCASFRLSACLCFSATVE